MTNRVYHAPSSQHKIAFEITDNIFQLNHSMDEHLGKLHSMIAIVQTNEKFVESKKSVLHNYFWLMEDEIKKLRKNYQKISAYLDLVK